MEPFDQHGGKSLRERLVDDKQWVDGRGRVHRIKKMDPEHRKNTIAWLRKHAEQIQQNFLMESIFESETTLDEVAIAVALPAEQWIHYTPVMRGLRKHDRKFEQRLDREFGTENL